MSLFTAVREDRTPGGKHKNANVLKIKIPSLEDSGQLQVMYWSSPMIESLLKISNSSIPQLKVAQENSDIKLSTIDYVIQLADWQIAEVWSWFNKLDFLSEIMNGDRQILIQNSLMEILAFGLARRSMKTGNSLLLGEGVYLDVEAANVAGIGDITQRILQLSAKFNELKLGEEEYVCLKIIVLLNPGLFPLP